MIESPLGDIEIWSIKGYRFTIHRAVALAHNVPVDGAKTLFYTVADLTKFLLAEVAFMKKGKK